MTDALVLYSYAIAVSIPALLFIAVGEWLQNRRALRRRARNAGDLYLVETDNVVRAEQRFLAKRIVAERQGGGAA